MCGPGWAAPGPTIATAAPAAGFRMEAEAAEAAPEFETTSNAAAVSDEPEGNTAVTVGAATLVPEYATDVSGGFVSEDPFVEMKGGRVRLNCTVRQSIAVFWGLLVLVVLLPLADDWLFSSGGDAAAEETQINGVAAIASVHAFYRAVDTKDLDGIAAAVAHGYTASVTGCASIGGAHVCSAVILAEQTNAGASTTGGGTAVFDEQQFEAMIQVHPAVIRPDKQRKCHAFASCCRLLT